MSRVILRKDGFMSYDAGAEEGTLTTVPLVFSGSHLELNLATTDDGQVEVELLREDGQAIPGFEFSLVDRIVGNFLAKTVTWQGRSDLSALRGQPVRLRFSLRKAKLYAFQFAR
jgi:hypothetical protein